MENKKVEILVGLFTLIAVIILILGFYWLKGVDYGQIKQEIEVEFPEIGGLEIGAPVYVSGVRKGEVKKITLTDKNVLVSIALAKDVELYADAMFYLKESGIMGDRIINIASGSGEKKLNPTESYQGTYVPGINEAVEKLDEAVNNINQLSISLSKIVEDTEKDGNLKRMFQDLSTLITQLNKIIKSSDGEFYQTLSHLANTMSIIDSLLIQNQSEINKVMARSDDAVRIFQESLIQFTNLVQEIKIFLTSIESENSTAGKLLQSDSLYKKIDKTISDLDSLLLDIKEKPTRYFKIKLW